MMTAADHYRSLARCGLNVLEEMVSDPEAAALHTRSHNYISDYEALRAAINDRPESEMIQHAIKEYQFGLFALAVGLYRPAFSSLRLCLELGLAAVHFSAHEIRFHRWAQNSGDIVWRSLLDNDEGVFAPAFISPFSSGLAAEGRQYGAIAEATYRECSEYVHGNARTHHATFVPLSFRRTTFLNWHDRAESVRLSIVFAFAARFLSHLPPGRKTDLEPVMLDVLGHLSAVQSLYSHQPNLGP